MISHRKLFHWFRCSLYSGCLWDMTQQWKEPVCTYVLWEEETFLAFFHFSLSRSLHFVVSMMVCDGVIWVCDGVLSWFSCTVLSSCLCFYLLRFLLVPLVFWCWDFWDFCRMFSSAQVVISMLLTWLKKQHVVCRARLIQWCRRTHCHEGETPESSWWEENRPQKQTDTQQPSPVVYAAIVHQLGTGELAVILTDYVSEMV